MASERKRILTGIRPTGSLHVGHYAGALENWLRLQDEYECIYCIVDVHALTSLDNTSGLQQNIYEMMLDWLAAGRDPHKSILFIQSQFP